MIESVPIGRIEVVASMVGYETDSRTVVATLGQELPINFRLNEKVFEEDEAVVTAVRPRDWKRNLERFTRELLGTSKNAEECTIVNPHVLDFITDDEAGSMRAFASEPLVVENRALGYDILFLLDDFQVFDWPYTIRYKGRPRFKKRATSSGSEKKGWQEAREKAYNGSMRHFLVSFINNTLVENGFDVYLGLHIVSNPAKIRLLPHPNTDSLVTRGVAPYEKLIYAPGVLHVVYQGEPEAAKYRRFLREVTGIPSITKRAQTSYLEFEQSVTVHATGYMYEPYLVTTHGYWTWERLADTLPRDYRPG